MPENYLIEIRLTGNILPPAQVSSRDLGELLASVEEMIAHVVARDNPGMGLDESQVTIGLAAVRQGSYVLEFVTQYEHQVAAAYYLASQAITTGDYGRLPLKSVEAIRKIRKTTRTLKAEAQFWERNGSYRQLATVTPQTEIDVKYAKLEGTTTLYGTVIRVGGIDPPRVALRLLDQTELTCRITQRNNFIVARDLGKRLYDLVGVRGKATWYADMAIQDFIVEEVVPYSAKTVDEALAALYQLAGAHYERIPDLDAFVSEIRGNDEEL